jgi:hypothetical protein
MQKKAWAIYHHLTLELFEYEGVWQCQKSTFSQTREIRKSVINMLQVNKVRITANEKP